MILNLTVQWYCFRNDICQKQMKFAHSSELRINIIIWYNSSKKYGSRNQEIFLVVSLFRVPDRGSSSEVLKQRKYWNKNWFVRLCEARGHKPCASLMTTDKLLPGFGYSQTHWLIRLTRRPCHLHQVCCKKSLIRKAFLFLSF